MANDMATIDEQKIRTRAETAENADIGNEIVGQDRGQRSNHKAMEKAMHR